ncbi:MAG: serine/threonine protein phosphatase [Bacillota bacterium]|nr:serine/threonine protein phosphatase [Bacillota bacterium]
MGFFKKPKQQDVDSTVQTVSSGSMSQHPFTVLNRYVPLCQAEICLYKTLREAVPIIDAAIGKIVRLIGDFNIVCDDENTQTLLNQFLRTVQVGACGQGILQFLYTYFDQMLTFGTAVGEIVLSSDNTTIAALYNASLEDVEILPTDSPLKAQICRYNAFGQSEPVPFPTLILTTMLNPEPGGIYGTSLLKGLPFVSSVLLKIFNSIGSNWERIGNVRFAVTYNPGDDVSAQAYSKERATQIATEWSKAMRNDFGRVNDFVAVGDVSIKVIGADNQVLDSEVPVRQILEQIVSKFGIPPFLLGLSWSSSERMSSQQSDILTSELEYYRSLLNQTIGKICSMWLRLNGKDDDFEIKWNNINLQDEVGLANARYLNAKASQLEAQMTEVNQ